MKRLLMLLLLLQPAFLVHANEQHVAGGKEYPDGHGGTVYLPLGDISFADKAISYTAGKRSPKGVHAQADQAIGIPDYTTPSAPGFTALGCDGSVVLQFVDNVLVDIEGADLYVFEVGPAVEPTELAISNDGENWLEVGQIAGARADVDIAQYIEVGDSFAYVRLTNRSRRCSGRTPGADIDAVAAVGSGYRLSLSSAVLFDVGQSVLKPEASQSLDDLATQINQIGGQMRLIVEGHTDSTGSTASNIDLSEQRAAAVWNALSSRIELHEKHVTIRGRGESHPVATNDSEEGRAQNRRVDLVVLPLKGG